MGEVEEIRIVCKKKIAYEHTKKERGDEKYAKKENEWEIILNRSMTIPTATTMTHHTMQHHTKYTIHSYIITKLQPPQVPLSPYLAYQHQSEC